MPLEVRARFVYGYELEESDANTLRRGAVDSTGNRTSESAACSAVGTGRAVVATTHTGRPL